MYAYILGPSGFRVLKGVCMLVHAGALSSSPTSDKESKNQRRCHTSEKALQVPLGDLRTPSPGNLCFGTIARQHLKECQSGKSMAGKDPGC